jgi:hypothetical protein
MPMNSGKMRGMEAREHMTALTAPCRQKASFIVRFVPRAAVFAGKEAYYAYPHASGR